MEIRCERVALGIVGFDAGRATCERLLRRMLWRESLHVCRILVALDAGAIDGRDADDFDGRALHFLSIRGHYGERQQSNGASRCRPHQ